MESFNDLLGKFIINIDNTKERDSDVIYFHLSDGSVYKLNHEQDCCESVVIEDIDGDLNDLIGSRITQADESTQKDINALESATWTFYRLATIKGYVTIRWYGESNGYYSESVDFVKIKDANIKKLRKEKLNKIDGKLH